MIKKNASFCASDRSVRTQSHLSGELFCFSWPLAARSRSMKLSSLGMFTLASPKFSGATSLKQHTGTISTSLPCEQSISHASFSFLGTRSTRPMSAVRRNHRVSI